MIHTLDVLVGFEASCLASGFWGDEATALKSVRPFLLAATAATMGNRSYDSSLKGPDAITASVWGMARQICSWVLHGRG